MTTPTWAGGGVEGRYANSLETTFNVLNEGAVGDATLGIDDGPVIRAVLAMAGQLGGMATVLIPPTDNGYLLASRSNPAIQASGCLNVPPNVRVVGTKTKLVMGNVTTCFFKVETIFAASVTITADTLVTDTTLTVADSSTLTVGQSVQVQMGQAAYDAGEPDWWFFAEVQGIPDATHVTLDRPCCYALSVAATPTVSHRAIMPMTLFAENVEINGFNMVNDMTGGANAEEGVYIRAARNIKLDNLTALNPGAGLVYVHFSDTVEGGLLEVQSCAKQAAHGAKGRGLSFAEARNVRFRNVTLRDCENQFVYSESRSESITIDTLRIENGFPGRSTTVGALITNGLGTLRIGDLWASGNRTFMCDTTPLGNGGPISIGTGTFAFAGDPTIRDLTAFDKIRVRGLSYSETKRFSRTFALTPSMSGVALPLPSGLARRVRIYASSTTGIVRVYLANTIGGFYDVAPVLVAGTTVQVDGTRLADASLGSTYQFNLVETKGLVVSTDATLVVGTYITIEMDYFVAQGVADDGSFAREDVPLVTTSAPDIQLFDTPGTFTWTKPDAVKIVEVYLRAAGGGGGSGAQVASGTIGSGASGGGGAGWTFGRYDANSLNATEAVIVGSGGAGGAAQATASTNGVDGSPGTVSRFGASGLRLNANPGLGGKGGIVGGGSTPGGAFGGGTVLGAAGGAGSSTGGAGGTAPASQGSAGGGAGGGLTAAPAASNGSSGGGSYDQLAVTAGAAGVADGGNGGNSASAADPAIPYPGCGGGGGASSILGPGGDGGDASLYGGGGGAGGASLNGSASGAGGAGAKGVVVVTSW